MFNLLHVFMQGTACVLTLTKTLRHLAALHNDREVNKSLKNVDSASTDLLTIPSEHMTQ